MIYYHTLPYILIYYMYVWCMYSTFIMGKEMHFSLEGKLVEQVARVNKPTNCVYPPKSMLRNITFHGDSVITVYVYFQVCPAGVSLVFFQLYYITSVNVFISSFIS